MNKLIQSIILTAVVLTPLSSLNLIADATMHHTSSHVSTLSAETVRTRRRVKKVRTKKSTMAKQRAMKQYQQQKSSQSNTNVSAPLEPTRIDSPRLVTPVTPPDTSVPVSQIKPIDPKLGNPLPNPNSNLILPNPAAGTPTLLIRTLGGIPNPTGNSSIPNPNLPTTLPVGSMK